VNRRAYIDWARGLAVLLMIEAHTVDAWTRAADRNTAAFGYATIVGGFAAPLFLWLAGLGVALSAARTARRTGSRGAAVRTACRRGFEIFLLALLFRLQAFILSPGGRALMILRVDVLNVMGPSMIAAALVWGASRRASVRITLFTLLAAIAALATPLVRHSSAVDVLPVFLQWYLRPSGEMTMFTLFPWAGFVFAGAAAGTAIDDAIGSPASSPRQTERLTLAVVGAAGAALVAVGFWTATRPTIYAVPSFFWTSSPTWFAVRVGVLALCLSALFALENAFAGSDHLRAVGRRLAVPLATLGRASLFVYWIHVELVYGYASWLWRRRLPLWGTAAAYAAFTAVMYGAVVVRNRYLARRAAEFPRPATLSEA